jgi:Tol biopolymer transport system component
MTDIRERLHDVDRTPVPDQWADIQVREPLHPAGPDSRDRVGAAVTGIVVGLLALLLVQQAFDRSGRPDPRTTRSPFPVAPRANGIVAFLRTDPQSTAQEGGLPETDLYVVDPQGTGIARLIARLDQHPPTWSPDGSQLAYVKDRALFSIDPDSGDSSQLIGCERPACHGIGSPAWSHEGTQIAFGQQAANTYGLWVVNADGTGPELLLDDIWFTVPAWSPDGRLIAVGGYVGDPQNEAIFVIDSESGDIVRTIPVPGLDLGGTVGWSPDGEWLVFDALGEGGVDFSDPSADAGAGIYLVRANGTGQHLLTSWACPENVCLALGPAWSPDGREVVFTRSLPELGSDGSLGDLHIIDVESGDVRQLTQGPGLDCCASWQPLPAEAVGEIEDVPCADDVSLRNALPASSDPKIVGVYFTCRADSPTLGTPQQPVYLAMREIPAALAGTLEERLEHAVRAYIAGPTPSETDRGYTSASPSSLADAIRDVRVDGGAATIDFSPDVADRLGNLGTATATDVFVIELGATVFQFEGVDRLILQVQGDCDRFWMLLERTCTVIERHE